MVEKQSIHNTKSYCQVHINVQNCQNDIKTLCSADRLIHCRHDICIFFFILLLFFFMFLSLSPTCLNLT